MTSGIKNDLRNSLIAEGDNYFFRMKKKNRAENGMGNELIRENIGF